MHAKSFGSFTERVACAVTYDMISHSVSIHARKGCGAATCLPVCWVQLCKRKLHCWSCWHSHQEGSQGQIIMPGKPCAARRFVHFSKPFLGISMYLANRTGYGFEPTGKPAKAYESKVNTTACKPFPTVDSVHDLQVICETPSRTLC